MISLICLFLYVVTIIFFLTLLSTELLWVELFIYTVMYVIFFYIDVLIKEFYIMNLTYEFIFFLLNDLT
jgi:hypothetical protein